MIICHQKQLIFIKTKKVGGTSFEIALSKFCGPEDVITPVSRGDEALRARLGFRGAQNFQNPVWPDGGRSEVTFTSHEPAVDLRAAVPAALWARYRKITIWRNPFDAMISRYYWRGGDRKGVSFGDFVARHSRLIDVNTPIAPLSGPAKLDTYLEYERLEEGLGEIGLGDVWAVFQGLDAKRGARPASATVEALYAQFPAAAARVADLCAEEIAAFGYRIPGR